VKTDKRDIDFLKTSDIVSTTECTGLIQGMPVDEAETDSYEDLYPIPEQQPLDPNGEERTKKNDGGTSGRK